MNHPDLALFLLRFGREESQVVEAFHGPDWYVNERYAGPMTFAYPIEVFRVREEERCPERIRFDTILNGQAVHANWAH